MPYYRTPPAACYKPCIATLVFARPRLCYYTTSMPTHHDLRTPFQLVHKQCCTLDRRVPSHVLLHVFCIPSILRWRCPRVLTVSSPSFTSLQDSFEDMKKRVAAVLAAAVAVAVGRVATVAGCSTTVVGKAASATGAVFASHSNDGDGGEAGHLRRVPAKDWAPNATRSVNKGASIPQVPHTFAYHTEGYAAMNEHQVGLAESTCYGQFSGGPHGIVDIVQLGKCVCDSHATGQWGCGTCVSACLQCKTCFKLATPSPLFFSFFALASLLMFFQSL